MTAPQTETTEIKTPQTKPSRTQKIIRRIVIICLYAPPAITLGQSLLQADTSADRLLSLAMLLFCIELARMAQVDLDNVAFIQPRLAPSEAEYSLLRTFRLTLFSTIVLELLGFYGTYSSLQWGAAVVLLSQLWFNLLAGIQLWPQQAAVIEVFSIKQRIPVLAANAIGLGLLGLWVFESARPWLSASLLALIILFLLLKYVAPAVHANSAQTGSVQPSQTVDEKNN